MLRTNYKHSITSLHLASIGGRFIQLNMATKHYILLAHLCLHPDGQGNVPRKCNAKSYSIKKKPLAN